MAAFGVEGSGDIAGVAGVGTGGDAQAWQSLADWFFPMGVFGVGGPGTGFDAPNGGYGVCGLGYSPTRYHRKYSTRAMRLECMGKAARVARQVWLASAPDLTPVSWASPIPTKSPTAQVSSEEAVYRQA